MVEEEKIEFKLPNKKTMKCVSCKHGAVNFLAMYCAKYKIKPNDVYYESTECEKYEPIDK